MCFGMSVDPGLDINHQLGLFMDRPTTACTALTCPGRRCTACPPLFPKLVRDGSLPRPDLWLVILAPRMIGVDTTAFSSVCCRTSMGVGTSLGSGERLKRVAQSERSLRRASERFVCERRAELAAEVAQAAGPATQRGTTWLEPATAVTAGTVSVTAIAGVTAPGHSGQGASHGTTHYLHSAGHSEHSAL